MRFINYTVFYKTFQPHPNTHCKIPIFGIYYHQTAKELITRYVQHYRRKYTAVFPAASQSGNRSDNGIFLYYRQHRLDMDSHGSGASHFQEDSSTRNTVGTLPLGIAAHQQHYSQKSCGALSPKLADAGSLPFPSGHAGSSFAAAYSLSRSYGKKLNWVWIVAALVALSRPYIGVHYLSDIICGSIFGVAGAALVCILWRKLIPAAEKIRLI